jgi:hypothetical protein
MKMKGVVPFSISLLIAAGLSLAASVAADSGRTPAPEGAKVYIITPEDGATVPRTFVVRFGLSGMGIAPAGADLPKTGHHHLLVDVDTLPPLDQPISADILHFGGGQTETQLTLPPGDHSLQMLLGDKNHIPHDPPIVSERITITVE